MKTSVEMIRKMGRFDVVQRTSDGMFNSSELLRQYNKTNNSDKKLSNFIGLSQTGEFIDELKSELLSQSEISYDGSIEVVTEIKGRNTKRGRTSDIVWMNPYLFIKFAMWLSPRFELQVIKFVADQLIRFRHEAGDNYNGLTSAVQRFKDINYPQLAKGLNWIVFNIHEAGIRNKANQEQLKELVDVQKKLAFACDMGYIKTFDELLNEMRRLYSMKYDTATS
jgi:hypothetical protein